MNEETYTLGVRQILLIAGLLKDVPTDELLNAMSRADTLGPILNPTLWMAASPNMRLLERIVQAAHDFRVVILRIQREHDITPETLRVGQG